MRKERLYHMMLTAILLCGPMTASAQDEPEFVVTQGDFHVLKQKGKTGIVELDYDQAKISNLHTMEISDVTVIKHLEENDSKAYRLASRRKPWRCSATAGTRRRKDTSNSWKRERPTTNS